MGLLNKLLGGSTIITLLLTLIFGYISHDRKTTIEKKKIEIKELKDSIGVLHTKNFNDSINNKNIVRETQSVLQQMNIENKSIKKENSNLRKGVRLDLLRVRVKRNGKVIDSTYTIAYKYLDK